MRLATVLAALALVVGPGIALSVSAQPMGTFRWQLQPYCNIITLAVVQQGGQYQLDGTDDQCGAARAASVRGMAFLNPNGTIGFGLTVVTTPGGTPIHIDAVVSLPSLNGTWQDSGGNSGNLIFGAGVPGAGPRPVPAGGLAPHSVTSVQIAPGAVTSAQLSAGAVTGAAVADGSITTADLAAPPMLVATPMTFNASVLLTNVASVIRTLTLTIPAPGQVLVNAAGMFAFNGAATTDDGYCTVSNTSTHDSSQYMIARERTADAMLYVPFAGVRVYPVVAGSFTVNLLCRAQEGSVTVYTPALTALYIPG